VLFALQLLFTFLVGSAWIYLTLRAGQRYGSKVSGFIGGLPSTALISFFFIGLTQSPQAASEATTAFPLVYGITGFFLAVYAWLIKRGFVFALGAGLLAWFFLAAIVASLIPRNFVLSLVAYVLIWMVSYSLLEFKIGVRSADRSKIISSPALTAIRSIFGGLIILLAVLIAKIGGPVWGGIFAAFPALFISTLGLAYKAYGADFSKAMTKSLFLSGTVTVVIYAIAIRYLYLSTGLYLGTLLSLLITAICAFWTYRFIQGKVR